ncbi:MAG: MBL fold metallo-hydrolase [Deltaproteobacteria bacterium]|nr:MAG: MBL fold metallo-hydrolase [Deltaproteobacteria bacterium]TNF29605.1 MAG: MBL fold metallo-hydrolase [Deltaproteobacteria bacterium]
MKIETHFHEDTFTLTYIVYDESSKDAVVIDPVLDYNPNSSSFFYDAIDKVQAFLEKESLNLKLILDTHAHADHLSGAQELKKRFPFAPYGIGCEITQVQEVFKGIYNLKELKTDGSQFDLLFADGQEMQAGTLKFKVLHTPGHTPACYSYLVEDCLFTGDALFMPDFGTGRCDFPRGSAEDLYNTVHDKLYSLPDETRVFVGHDYQPEGRELKFETSIGESKAQNKQLKASTSKEEFVKFRSERDAVLDAPRLLLPSIQVNIDGAKFPQPEDNGAMYLKIPFRARG